jgi:hypothetical protein
MLTGAVSGAHTMTAIAGQVYRRLDGGETLRGRRGRRPSLANAALTGDPQVMPSATVKDILCNQVGLGGRDVLRSDLLPGFTLKLARVSRD